MWNPICQKTQLDSHSRFDTIRACGDGRIQRHTDTGPQLIPRRAGKMSGSRSGRHDVRPHTSNVGRVFTKIYSYSSQNEVFSSVIGTRALNTG